MTDPIKQDSLNNDTQAPTLWGWPTYLSIIIAIIILIFAARMVDLKEIWREIAACDKRYVILGSPGPLCNLSGARHALAPMFDSSAGDSRKRQIRHCLFSFIISWTTWYLQNWEMYMPPIWPALTLKFDDPPPWAPSFFCA